MAQDDSTAANLADEAARLTQGQYVSARVHSHRVGDGAPEETEPASASLARQARAFGAFRAWCESDGLPRTARWLAVVRAVDASRPGLTEEQAREMLTIVRELLRRWDRRAEDTALGAHAMIEALRPFASRGETGPAPDPTSAVVREAEDDERDAGKLGTFLANAMLAGNVVRR